MRRRQLFEFHDEAWFPDLIREGQLEILAMANRTSGFSSAIAEPLAGVLDQTAARTVLDLCSGAGSPVITVLEALADTGRDGPELLLSDLYPKLDGWREQQANSRVPLAFVERPVDATNIPEDIDAELVTVVNALHHFPFDVAVKMIEAVTRRGSALFIAEAFPRNLFFASAYLPPLGLAWLKNPFVCERRGLAKALLSFPLPAITLTGLWDWLVSALRIHEPEELAEAARSIAPDYQWSCGASPYGPWGRAVYLSGVPQDPAQDAFRNESGV